MKHHLIKFSYLVSALLICDIASAQEVGNALPDIPSYKSPPATQKNIRDLSEEKKMTKGTTQPQSYNPLIEIIEKQKKKEKSGGVKSWTSSEEAQRLEVQKLEEAQKSAENNGNVATMNTPQSQEINAEPLVSNEDKIKFTPLQKEQDPAAKPTSEKKESHDIDPKISTTKNDNDVEKENEKAKQEQIDRINAALKSLEKPKEPTRLWDVE